MRKDALRRCFGISGVEDVECSDADWFRLGCLGEYSVLGAVARNADEGETLRAAGVTSCCCCLIFELCVSTFTHSVGVTTSSSPPPSALSSSTISTFSPSFKRAAAATVAAAFKLGTLWCLCLFDNDSGNTALSDELSVEDDDDAGEIRSQFAPNLLFSLRFTGGSYNWTWLDEDIGVAIRLPFGLGVLLPFIGVWEPGVLNGEELGDRLGLGNGNSRLASSSSSFLRNLQALYLFDRLLDWSDSFSSGSSSSLIGVAGFRLLFVLT